MADTYIKVNDGLPEHRKIVAAGGDAGWLHICALAYSSRNLTDGRIPTGMVPRLSDRKKPADLAAKLVIVGLWHSAGHQCERCPQPGPDEYVIHDYLEHQRSAEKVAEIKQKRAEAGATGGARKAANRQRPGGAPPKQTPSNLLDAGYEPAETNGNPEAEAEEVLRTSRAETDEDVPPTAGPDEPGGALILVVVPEPEADQDEETKTVAKPRKSRKKPDRTPHDDQADELTNGYWDRYQATTAQTWIAIRQIVLTALTNGAPRNDLAWALDGIGKKRMAVTGPILTIALGEKTRGNTRGPTNLHIESAAGDNLAEVFG